MVKIFKINIDENKSIKKIASIASAIAILILSSIIIFNTLKVHDDSGLPGLSSADKILKHFIIEHEVNTNNFVFIKIDFKHINYFEKRSDLEINIAASISLFLISSTIIFYVSPCRKNYCTEKFLFTIGYKNSLFRPPKYSS